MASLLNDKQRGYQSVPQVESYQTQVTVDAREAFQRGDVEASKRYHQSRAFHNEAHSDDAINQYLKSIVYGGLDGIITTFATVTSVTGADLSPVVIIILGIAHLLADGLSMGLGDALSSQAEMDFNNSERRRERWEMENNIEGELDEMVELYMKKGISKEDAEVIIHTLAKYPDAFLDTMMVEELGLLPIDGDESPLKEGLVTMLSFMIFGCVPLAPYLIALLPGFTLTASTQLYAAIISTVVTLFLLGAFKARLVDARASAIKGGLIMAVNGSVAAALGYLIGWALTDICGIKQAP